MKSITIKTKNIRTDSLLEKTLYSRLRYTKGVNNMTKVEQALVNKIRVNKANHTVEIYNEFGVHIVLRDLDEDTFKEFLDKYYAF